MPIFDKIERFGATLRKTELQKVELPDNKFGQAVAVYGHRTGDVFNIGSAREALDWMLYEWPERTSDSPKARAAWHACVAALDGGDSEIARLAFRQAVEEAGNLIGDVDRIYKPSKR
jgi:hypothetical protein